VQENYLGLLTCSLSSILAGDAAGAILLAV